MPAGMSPDRLKPIVKSLKSLIQRLAKPLRAPAPPKPMLDLEP